MKMGRDVVPGYRQAVNLRDRTCMNTMLLSNFVNSRTAAPAKLLCAPCKI